MKLTELADQVVIAHPGIAPAIATDMLRTALESIRAQIEAQPDGEVSVPVLGRFRIKQVERERDGQRSQVRRTVFVARRPRAAEGEVAAQAAE